MDIVSTVRAFLAAQPPVLLIGLAAVVALLSVAGAIATVLTALKPGKDYRELRQRIASWWVMVALLAGALLLGWQATVAVFALISFMALREFLSLAPIRKEDRPAILAAYLILVAAYGFIAADRYMFYLVFIPVWTFLGLPFLMASAGPDAGFLTTAATFHWGLVTCVYNLGFAAFLMRTPDTEKLPAGVAGLVFFLLLVTEFNDVAQYVFGKLSGRHKIAPTVSPNKTWEGFLGGWLASGPLGLVRRAGVHALGRPRPAGGRPGPAGGGLRRRRDHERGQARHRGQGHLPRHPRPRRSAGPRRQPDLHRPALLPPAGAVRPGQVLMGWLRFLLLVLVARPLALFLTGADVTGRERPAAAGTGHRRGQPFQPCRHPAAAGDLPVARRGPRAAGGGRPTIS